MSDIRHEPATGSDMAPAAGAGTQPAQATDHRGLHVLNLEECLELLRNTPVGRVGFVHDGEVVILPVNHIVQGTQVLFRTTWGAKLQSAADEAGIAYQVDHHDVTTRTGWSVLVQGSAEVVYGTEECQLLDTLAPEPWLHLGEDAFWVRILAVQISGREIVVRPASA